jgi:uncharacterized protein YheU (UPF0270 family)
MGTEEEENISLYLLISEFTDGMRLRYEELQKTLNSVLAKVSHADKLLIQLDMRVRKIQTKPIDNVAVGIKAKEIVADLKEEEKSIPVVKEVIPETFDNIVVSYVKKDGTNGFKAKKPIEHENQKFTYLQECKYGCGYWVSWDNYKKGIKPLHINKDDLHVYGRSCPKYD